MKTLPLFNSWRKKEKKMQHDDDHFLLNRHEQKQKRRELRKHGTVAEAIMWKRLRAKQMDGLQWKRQVSIGNYIMDFYCPKANLCIELDGNMHYIPAGAEHDLVRTKFFNEKCDILVLRFENKVVLERNNEVFEYIREIAKERIAINSSTASGPPPL